MQAIITKYLGPTNTMGSRIKARAYAGSITVTYDHAIDSDANHKRAATALADKYGWLDDGTKMVSGSLPDNTGYAFLMV